MTTEYKLLDRKNMADRKITGNFHYNREYINEYNYYIIYHNILI